ncbi:coilin [Drosophila busckii]|nr:coilin [Drosophila busckii]
MCNNQVEKLLFVVKTSAAKKFSMDNFALKIDLSNYFKDARKCSLVSINRSWSNIKDLQDHIQKLFHLNNISLLTNDGYYLPPKESILLLNPGQSLIAFNLDVEESLTEASHIEENTRKETIEPVKKRKNCSNDIETELTCSTPRPPKRSKQKNATPNASVAHASIKEIDNTHKQKSNTRTTKSIDGELQLTSIADTGQQIEAVLTVVQTDNNNHIIFNENEIVQAQECTEETPSKTIFICPLMKLHHNTPREFKGVRQEEPIKILEDIIIKPAVETVKQEKVQSPLNLESVDVETVASAKPLEIPAVISSPAKHEQSTIEAECKVPNEQCSKVIEQSLLESDSEDEVMVLDDTTLDDSDSDVQTVTERSTNAKKDTTQEVIADLLQNAVSLSDLPCANDTLLFKLPMPKRHSAASSTGYIAGLCTYVNRRTKVVTISIIACAVGLRNVLNKYANSLDDSTDEISTLNVNFKELIKPKVVVTAVD